VTSKNSVSGLMNINKPVGPTSFQIIERLRRLTGIRKIGHTGTLDPLASGVLPICLGRAVRLSEYLTSENKVYRAEITFGVRTTTDDAEGEVVSRQEVTLQREEIEDVLPEFTGDVDQVPPQYAAIKIAGKHMYDLARHGTPVEAAPRQIRIEQLALLDWSSPRALVEIACSKGTYIRALARDLGERLGCGAYLTALRRTRCGTFNIEDAVGFDELNATPDWRIFLLPLDVALQDWPALYLDADGTQRIAHGHAVHALAFGKTGTLVRGYAVDGRFCAVLRVTDANGELRPEKVFLTVTENGADE
jgi:tRNA pseudouridine55 synthase